jgi:hypothetical protein
MGAKYTKLKDDIAIDDSFHCLDVKPIKSDSILYSKGSSSLTTTKNDLKYPFKLFKQACIGVLQVKRNDKNIAIENALLIARWLF